MRRGEKRREEVRVREGVEGGGKCPCVNAECADDLDDLAAAVVARRAVLREAKRGGSTFCLNSHAQSQ
jgi:hypothetical protein